MNILKVEICFGTTCHVMGGAELLEVEDSLPEEIAPFVDIHGIGCLDFCMEQSFGKAPFVRIENEVHGDMTKEKLIELITNKVVTTNK